MEIYLGCDRVESTANNLVLRIVPLAVGALLLLQLIRTPIRCPSPAGSPGTRRSRGPVGAGAVGTERERQIAADLHDGVVQDNLAGRARSRCRGGPVRGRGADGHRRGRTWAGSCAARSSHCAA